MRSRTFLLIVILLSLLAILAIAYHELILTNNNTSYRTGPTAAPEVPVITARPPLTLVLAANLTLPDLNGSPINMPRLTLSKSSAMGLGAMITPSPTAEPPRPTPMQPMEPMKPWTPTAAMTPMLP